MSNYQPQPLKLYIQDIFRANRTQENKYIYELFDLKFKNVMIHGVVTAVYNSTDKTTNIEISDPTGTVQVYYDTTKSNSYLKEPMIRNLNHQFTTASKYGDENIGIMATLMERIKKNKVEITEGDFVSVIGDIFVDDRSCRMVSAYECVQTTIQRDLIWLEELKYLYDKFYLQKKSQCY